MSGKYPCANCGVGNRHNPCEHCGMEYRRCPGCRHFNVGVSHIEDPTVVCPACGTEFWKDDGVPLPVEPPPSGMEYFERTEGSPIRWLVGMCFRLLLFIENPLNLLHPIKTLRSDPKQRRTGENPWAVFKGDWMFDPADGRYDRVWDATVLPYGWTLADCEADPRKAEAGWVPRRFAAVSGDPEDRVWDPLAKWVLRRKLASSEPYTIRPDQSSGDGSGA